MKKLPIALGAAALGASLLRPKDSGAPHAGSFATWNEALRRSGPGRPILLLDLDALDANLQVVKQRVAPHIRLRIVAKSLPSIPLLAYAMERLGCGRLMVFDDSMAELADAFPEADLLGGKPLPVQGAAEFYARRAEHSRSKLASISAESRDAGAKVQWLIDTPERLAQYLGLARSLGVKMRVNLEVDVGMRRGGIATLAEMGQVLREIAANPDHLTFSGLMGYDAHATAAPPVISSEARAIADVEARYAAFVDAVRAHDPAWIHGETTLNGAGSQTHMMYKEGGPVGEVALGSALVMPARFDSTALARHRPALFIATPVLKRLEGTHLPFIEFASKPWAFWDRNREVTYFIYGGGWMARAVSPAGLTENPLYGFSTNQAILNGSRATSLSVDDWVFFRPDQSERVMQNFGDLHLFRGADLVGTWPVLLPFSRERRFAG